LGLAVAAMYLAARRRPVTAGNVNDPESESAATTAVPVPA
jgi:hypothetical protein